jgi:acetyl esterase/lipase
MRPSLAVFLGAGLALASPVLAQPPQPSAPGNPQSQDTFLGVATYKLWDGDAPGQSGTEPGDVPTLTLFQVHRGTGNGTAMIIAPGGAYRGLAANLEGRQVTDWFTSRGVTAFVLRYRLGNKYLYPTPLVDARRAIRFVRARAAEFGIRPDRIGMMGFSAGGHLTAMAATMPEAGQPDAADPIDRVGSRPDFIVLGYPWLNAMIKDQKVLSYCGVLKIEAAKCGAYEQYTPEKLVTKDTPPVFIYNTTDDELVPVDGSATFYRALVAAGVPAEMHIFRTGRHGSGLGLGDPSLDSWMGLTENWMRGLDLISKAPAPQPPAPR